MDSVSARSRLRWAFVAWLLLLPAAPVAGAGSLVVQQIGDLSGSIAEAVAEEAVAAGVTVVPFSPRLDARATPIILTAGKAFLSRQGGRVLGLRPAERSALRQAYAAGQVILLLDASTHDIKALHVLVKDGVAHESTTDPVVLAYALRQENRIPTARLVTHPVEDDFDDGDLDEDELALSRALEIVVAELTRPPAAPADDDAAAGLPDWRNSPVQSTVLTSTANDVYDTPVEIYALHSCLDRRDYYLVNSGGDWTPTGARYESASVSSGQMRVDLDGNLTVDWQESDSYCDVGYFLDPERICRYMNYPLSYEVNIIPPSGPAVQIDTTRPRAGNYDKSADYESGLSAVFLGPVNVSGNGPSSGIQVGDVSWNNSARGNPRTGS